MIETCYICNGEGFTVEASCCGAFLHNHGECLSYCVIPDAVCCYNCNGSGIIEHEVI